MHTMNFNIILFCFSVATSGIEEHKLLILFNAENNGNDSLIAKTIHLLQIGDYSPFFSLSVFFLMAQCPGLKVQMMHTTIFPNDFSFAFQFLIVQYNNIYCLYCFKLEIMEVILLMIYDKISSITLFFKKHV